jgi:tryptophan halogenase
MKNVQSVLVVGGGTAGLIAAITLKRKLDIQIDVVHSKNIGIVGVGEGSTEHFREFMIHAGIDQYTLIKECDATYKCGIMFEGWGTNDYLHSVSGILNSKVGQYSHVYANMISNTAPTLAPKPLWDSRVPKSVLGRSDNFIVNQFHFNTYKLNDFLIRFAKEIGIRVIEDDINDVLLNEQGEIKSLVGVQRNYDYDFYIDSTGFKRLLINKLGAKWVSYSKYLKMKAAIAFPTSDTDNYNMWTLAKAMDYGWLFRLPTFGRGGNGYIYDSDYITAEQAKQEVEQLLGHEVEVGKTFNFDPGALEQAWIKNCCAVGLASNFVEPLEASSIGSSIQQSFMLMHRLSNYDEISIHRYNKSFNDLTENIRDFVLLHYVTRKDNSNFWKDVAQNDITDSLGANLENWQGRMPIAEDFNEYSDYIMFKEDNFIMVMDGLNLFNRSAIRKEYSSMNQAIKDSAESILRSQLEFEKNTPTFSHKEMLELIRKYY